jgi:hypothetical protein
MYGNTCGVAGLSCFPVEDPELGEELSLAFALRPPATRRGIALAFPPIEKMSDGLIIPSIMLRRGQKWNGGYKLIVRLGATANKKERSCPRFLIVEFFGVRAMHAARSDNEGTFPIFGARARKQGSEQLSISLLVRTALEPATRPL